MDLQNKLEKQDRTEHLVWKMYVPIKKKTACKETSSIIQILFKSYSRR